MGHSDMELGEEAARVALVPRLALMRDAHARDPMPDWPTRQQNLRLLDQMLRRHRAALAAAIDADFGGRSAEETDFLEMFPTHSNLKHALRHGRRWMRGSHGWANFWLLPGRRAIVLQPLGVVGIIAPWNYPLFLSAGPLIDALAAGNRVMIKVSELTPQFAALFAQIVAEYFPPEWVTVVTGDAHTARAFSTLPFDHLLFTGSTAVGHQVMRAASEHLTPVTLELGGKSPAIVGPNARFEQAVERILVGKLVNAGQTCVAPDYVMVPRAQVPTFIEMAKAVAARLYPDVANNAQYSNIISPRHFERLVALADEAQARGATLHPLFDVGSDSQRRRMPPVLLTEVSDEMRLMCEEIFGPLLPIMPYDDLEEALAYINARPRPLALYVFDAEAPVVNRVIAGTISGGVTVNDTLLHVAEHGLPFGGVGASGMGSYHGAFGFRTFSRMKPVFRQAQLNGMGWLNPPYGKRFAMLMKQLLR